MFFSSNLKTLTVATNATASTTEPSYSASFVDTLSDGTKLYKDKVGALTGATAVAVVDAIPINTLLRDIQSVTIVNRDTVSHTFTVSKKEASVSYTVASAVLGVLESMVFDGSKWTVYTAAGEAKVTTLGAALSTSGVKNGATVTATETGNGVLHQTTLTLAATPITMRDTEQGGGVKLYTFPEGRILVLGAIASIAPTTTSALATTLHAGVTGNFGVGTVTQANATLATTEQNIVQVTAFTSSATINVAPAVAKGVGVLTPLDGTTTPIDAYLNLAVAGAGDIDGNATVTVSGTVTLSWINLGDM